MASCFQAPSGTRSSPRRAAAAFRLGWPGWASPSPATRRTTSRTRAAAAARREVESLTGRADIIVALTHLSLADDEALAEATPHLDLVIGGHEHENVLVRRGPNLTPVAKADSNARTVYVHRLRFDTVSRHLDIDSKLVPITDSTPEDSAIAAAVVGWRDRAFEGFRKEGFEPLRVAATTTIDLDGREASVRTRCTSLTRLIAAGMVRAVPGASGAIYNSDRSSRRWAERPGHGIRRPADHRLGTLLVRPRQHPRDRCASDARTRKWADFFKPSVSMPTAAAVGR